MAVRIQCSLWSSRHQRPLDSRQRPSPEDEICWLSPDSIANSLCKTRDNHQGCPEGASESSNWASETSHPAVNREQHHHWWHDTTTTHHKKIPPEGVYRCIWRDRKCPGRKYHIQLKGDYKPVQHPMWHVALSLKSDYRTELDRPLKLGTVTEVREYTASVNSIVLVKKLDGYLRLCLDPKDLNKNIKQNQWYSQTINNILSDLPGSTLFILLDAKCGYWHVILDRESRLMTVFNTPCGKFRWLWLPFGLKVAEDVFQERLDRMLKGIQNIHNISDDVLVDGKAEVSKMQNHPARDCKSN